MLKTDNPVDNLYPEINIINYGKYSCHKSRLDVRILKIIIREMMRVIDAKGFKIGTIITNFITDKEIAELNRKFLNCAGPTNVLSFPGMSDSSGILYISMDTVKREAFMYGQVEDEYLLRLVAHGLSHLAGLEHGTEMDHVQFLCEKEAIALLDNMLWNA